ncbi:FxsA family protein [Campylobacter sp. RM12920]|uniref:FxsA family protein n=1 Tax=Campylobacter californiensis TaxID=1032243 RepID=A0ABD4JGN8_9BACT|nr:FxsA family protein [Campylobacter sp. RM12919]MBE2987310.1 FxsA family protein [Campylobacter sp. RM12920]
MLRITFLPYLIIELILAYLFIIAYGFFAFFSEVMISGFIGILLMFRLGFGNIFSQNNMQDMFGGLKIFNAISLGLGGLLLFLPGLLTDAIGICVIIASLFFKPKVDNTQNFTHNYTYYEFSSKSEDKNNSEIIDVEVVDEPKSVR